MCVFVCLLTRQSYVLEAKSPIPLKVWAHLCVRTCVSCMFVYAGLLVRVYGSIKVRILSCMQVF